MKEYEKVSHLANITVHIEDRRFHYLPDHKIYSRGIFIMKLHAAFNALSQTNNGESLNCMRRFMFLFSLKG